MEEEQRRGAKNVRKSICVKIKEGKRKATLKNLKANAEDSEVSDDGNLCVVYVESFGNSKPKKVQVKCAQCSLWLTKSALQGYQHPFVIIVTLIKNKHTTTTLYCLSCLIPFPMHGKKYPLLLHIAAS